MCGTGAGEAQLKWLPADIASQLRSCGYAVLTPSSSAQDAIGQSWQRAFRVFESSQKHDLGDFAYNDESEGKYTGYRDAGKERASCALLLPKTCCLPRRHSRSPILSADGAGEAEFLEVRLMGSATVPRVGWVEGFDEMIVTTFRELDVRPEAHLSS